ncbi:MAG: biotin--[acetyl-CoA-carboxylase] ligase [Flavobacteriales bacterium]
MAIYFFDVLDSTNTYLKAHQTTYQHGDCIVAHEQKAGKGQLGNSWESEAYKNLHCSMLIKWSRLKAEDAFQISKWVSLVLMSVIKSIDSSFEPKIKWPNDLYLNGKKIAGILIENSIQNRSIDQSIIGIGLNVNQLDFNKPLDKTASSLAIESEKYFDLSKITQQIHDELNEAFDFGQIHQKRNLNTLYLRHLLGLDELRYFEDKDGVFQGIIKNVDDSGKLNVLKVNPNPEQTIAQKTCSYDLKELKFL